MDNTETLTKFGTPDTGWRKTKQRKEINTKQKNKKISNTDPIWKPCVNTGALGGKQRLIHTKHSVDVNNYVSG